ncbi:MAG: stage III sporulation protein AF [Lachnospiraceae bacterium]|nr:stage III sporulation protein AF [Lachnospiraceae bacterium]
MINEFLEFIKRMGIFLICAESILYFAPGNSYQKYIRVLIGFMILMQFMIPVKAILTGQDRTSIENQVNEFRLQIESLSDEQSVEVFLPNQETLVEKSIAEEIKSRLNNSLSEEKLDFTVIDIELGNITRVILRKQTFLNDAEFDGNMTVKIDKITVGEINRINNESLSGEENEDTEHLMNLFCRELKTSKEYLEVVIVE